MLRRRETVMVMGKIASKYEYIHNMNTNIILMVSVVDGVCVVCVPAAPEAKNFCSLSLCPSPKTFSAIVQMPGLAACCLPKHFRLNAVSFFFWLNFSAELETAPISMK